MLARISLAAIALLALPALAPLRCPATDGRDAPACDALHGATTIARCLEDAHATESCADRATGVTHAIYLVRAASELTKAGIASGSRTARARRLLAHATVLDERVQDDPSASPALRDLARANEEKAKKALFPH